MRVDVTVNSGRRRRISLGQAARPPRRMSDHASLLNSLPHRALAGPSQARGRLNVDMLPASRYAVDATRSDDPDTPQSRESGSPVSASAGAYGSEASSEANSAAAQSDLNSTAPGPGQPTKLSRPKRSLSFGVRREVEAKKPVEVAMLGWVLDNFGGARMHSPDAKGLPPRGPTRGGAGAVDSSSSSSSDEDTTITRAARLNVSLQRPPKAAPARRPLRSNSGSAASGGFPSGEGGEETGGSPPAVVPPGRIALPSTRDQSSGIGALFSPPPARYGDSSSTSGHDPIIHQIVLRIATRATMVIQAHYRGHLVRKQYPQMRRTARGTHKPATATQPRPHPRAAPSSGKPPRPRACASFGDAAPQLMRTAAAAIAVDAASRIQRAYRRHAQHRKEAAASSEALNASFGQQRPGKPRLSISVKSPDLVPQGQGDTAADVSADLGGSPCTSGASTPRLPFETLSPRSGLDISEAEMRMKLFKVTPCRRQPFQSMHFQHVHGSDSSGDEDGSASQLSRSDAYGSAGSPRTPLDPSYGRLPDLDHLVRTPPLGTPSVLSIMGRGGSLDGLSPASAMSPSSACNGVTPHARPPPLPPAAPSDPASGTSTPCVPPPPPPPPPGKKPPPPPVAPPPRHLSILVAGDNPITPTRKGLHGMGRKQLHWEALPANVLGQTFWSSAQVDVGHDHGVDTEMLDNLFSQTAAASSAPKAADALIDEAARSKGKAVISILDLKRASLVEIMLTQSKMAMEELVEAINNMDGNKIPEELVDQIPRQLPTDSELKALKAYTGDPELLGTAEKYFLAISTVPRLEQKLVVITFRRHFEPNLLFLSSQHVTLAQASEEVHASNRLRRLLETVLMLGNLMNSSRKKAKGFKLDSLQRLGGMKSTDGRTTLLHYLVAHMERTDESVLDLDQEIPHVQAATKLSLPFMLEELAELKAGLAALAQEVEAAKPKGPGAAGLSLFAPVNRKDKQHNVRAERLYKRLNSFFKDASKSLEQLEKTVANAKGWFARAAVFFGESPDAQPNEFFGKFAAFMQHLKLARADRAKVLACVSLGSAPSSPGSSRGPSSPTHASSQGPGSPTFSLSRYSLEASLSREIESKFPSGAGSGVGNDVTGTNAISRLDSPRLAFKQYL
eukprot:jgi/Mesvir1/4190/Mv08898-RA.3